MNASTIPSWFTRRRFVWILSCGAAILVATVVAASSARPAPTGEATPYTPTRGEWMCLLLNSPPGCGEQPAFGWACRALRVRPVQAGHGLY